jgi:putative membrane protein
MRRFLLRLIVTGIAIVIVAKLLSSGIHITNDDLGTLVIIALVISLVNAIIRPVVMFLSCPFIILSLGILVPVINGLMLMLAAGISGGRLQIDNLGWAIVAGLIMMVVVLVLERRPVAPGAPLSIKTGRRTLPVVFLPLSRETRCPSDPSYLPRHPTPPFSIIYRLAANARPAARARGCG